MTNIIETFSNIFDMMFFNENIVSSVVSKSMDRINCSISKLILI